MAKVETLTCPSCEYALTTGKALSLPDDKKAFCPECKSPFKLGEARRLTTALSVSRPAPQLPTTVDPPREEHRHVPQPAPTPAPAPAPATVVNVMQSNHQSHHVVYIGRSYSRGLAAFLEFVGGLFGCFGIGHLYKGRVFFGFMLLLGWWLFAAVSVALSILTSGAWLIPFFCIWAIALLVCTVSAAA